MSISRIPNPDFVPCVDCIYRRPKKTFLKNGIISHLYYCYRGKKPRRLFGQKGCDHGKRKSSDQVTQLTFGSGNPC